MKEQRSPWVILGFLCIPVFIGSLDLTVVSAILPEVLVSLELPVDTRLDDASWMVTGYLLAYTISMTFAGRLSDLIGRRSVYIACLLIFMFGSYFVVIAHTWPVDVYLRIFRQIDPNARPPSLELRTLNMIILGRVIQAIGAGAMVPVTMAMVADLFPAANRARPIALVSTIDTIGWVLGHLYGGIVVRVLGQNEAAIRDFFSGFGLDIGTPDWRFLFWINIVFGVVTLAALVATLRNVPQRRRREGFDLLGTALIAAALTIFTFGLGGASPESVGEVDNASNLTVTPELLLLGAVLFVVFVLVEVWVKYPLIQMKSFQHRNVALASFANVCIGFCLTIGLVALPLLVNFRSESLSSDAIQEAALVAGVLLSALTIPMALAAIPGAWLTDKRGYAFTVTLGTGLAVVGFLFCGLTWTPQTPYGLMAAQIALVGVGLGLTITPIASAVINEARYSERGASSALVLALRLVGMTIALSALTTFAINRVNNLVAEASGEGAVFLTEEPTELAEGATFLDGSIAGAVVQVNLDALYLVKIVQVVNELFLLGAVVCGAALLAAVFMRGGRASELAHELEPEDLALTESPPRAQPVPTP